MKSRRKIIAYFSSVMMSVAGLLLALAPATNAIEEDIIINVANYGYGEYIVTAEGIGMDGALDKDQVVFYYYPVYAEITEDENTGATYADLEYTADDGTETSAGDVAKIVIEIYDQNGNLVSPMSPITVTPPTKRVELPFADYDLPSGTYKIAVSAYDRSGNLLYKPYTLEYVYNAIPVPDTCSFFQELNISQTDYLVTGLIVFFLVGIGGAMFVMSKKDKKASSRRKR